MNHSADIRKENKKAIYHLMLDGQPYTKQQAAAHTGLSVATCNTLLNEMAEQKLVSGSRKQSGAVGRNSVLYQINDDYECYLALHFYVEHRTKWIEYVIFSVTGRILLKERQSYETVDPRQVEAIISELADAYPRMSQIIIGTPSVVQRGVIRYCDIPELENVPMKELLERRFSLPVTIENDMHHKAYGYYQKTGNREDVISLGYFPSGILPGTATIHKGMMIRGAENFAGMTGFLPYDVSRQEQLKMLKPGTCIPFIAKSVCALIVLLNPGTIVLTGDLINETSLEKIIEKCREDIPKEYLPEFRIVENFDAYYYEGMYRAAVDRKEF